MTCPPPTVAYRAGLRVGFDPNGTSVLRRLTIPYCANDRIPQATTSVRFGIPDRTYARRVHHDQLRFGSTKDPDPNALQKNIRRLSLQSHT